MFLVLVQRVFDFSDFVFAHDWQAYRSLAPQIRSPVARAFDLNGGVTPILATASWAPLVQTVVGAFIGAGGAIAGGTFSSWFAHQMERQSLAQADFDKAKQLGYTGQW